VSTYAAGIYWTVDDGTSQGNATGGPTDWGIDWNLGTPKLSPITVDGTWVMDGTYRLQAQAKDSRGVPGEAKTAIAHINRHAPGAVTGFQGGYNSRFGIVDLRWTRYPERDVIGYRVYRVADNKLICPSNGAPTTSKLSGADPAPLPAGSEYRVVAVDCLDLAAASCSPREGAPSSKTGPSTATTPPDPPTALVPSVVNGVPEIDWTAPTGGASILFYRIYRDTGNGFPDRYDATITNATHYSDPDPGTLTTQHTYWVTAVDVNFNESAPSAPVTTQPVTP
jgi:hypothetical protein